MALYFASQGAGKMAATGSARCTARWIVAASYVLFGGINLFAMASGLGWGRRLPALAIAHDKKVAVG